MSFKDKPEDEWTEKDWDDYKKSVNYKEKEDGEVEFTDLSKIADLSAESPEPKTKEKLKKKSKQTDKEDLPKFIINKYSQGPTKALYEAVFVANQPFYVFNDSGQIKFTDQIVEDHRILIPPQSVNECFTKPYPFASSEEVNKLWEIAKNLTMNDLFLISRKIWDQYFYHKSHVIDFFAAATIFTYFQDRFYSLFYPFMIGDTDTGKGTVLELAELIAYRPYRAANVTEASIFRVLGWIEEGQCIMLLDEANKMSDTMIEIHKSGYKRKAYVLRTEDTGHGRVVFRFLTFGQRWFAAEKSLDTKGIDERCFYNHAIKHKPKVSLWKVLTPNNEIIYQKRLREFDQFRKLLLFYRMFHYNEEFPRIKINKEAREEELAYPLLQMFYGTESQNIVVDCIDKLLEDRTNVRLETIQGMLHAILMKVRDGNEKMVDSEEKEAEILKYNRDNPEYFAISLETIDSLLLLDSEGDWKYQKDGQAVTNVMISKRLGEISAKDRTKILRDAFQGQRIRLFWKDKQFRVWQFPVEQLKSLEDTYTQHKGLEILGKEDDQIEDYKSFGSNDI